MIELRYGLTGCQPCTLEEVGKAFGVTRERNRQIENNTLKKLGGCRKRRASETDDRRKWESVFRRGCRRSRRVRRIGPGRVLRMACGGRAQAQAGSERR